MSPRPRSQHILTNTGSVSDFQAQRFSGCWLCRRLTSKSGSSLIINCLLRQLTSFHLHQDKFSRTQGFFPIFAVQCSRPSGMPRAHLWVFCCVAVVGRGEKHLFQICGRKGQSRGGSQGKGNQGPVAGTGPRGSLRSQRGAREDQQNAQS